MVNQLQFTNPQAYSGGADFSPLAGLYDTYKAAQARATQETALGQLGTDPTTNIGVLLQSRDPKLVQLGLRLQEQQAENKRSDAYLGLQQNAARRIEEDRAKAEQYRQAAPGLYEGMLGGNKPPTAVAQSPFPSASAPTGLPPGIGAPPPQAPAAAPPAFGDRFAGAPPASNEPPAAFTDRFAGAPPPDIPVKAEDTSGGLPEWASSQSLAGRIVGSMAAGVPAAATGIDNKTLAAALANPDTHEVAKVFAQNKLNPGTWKVNVDKDTGRVVAVNDKSAEVRYFSPDGSSSPMSKEERVAIGHYKAGRALGLDHEGAQMYAQYGGKVPARGDLPTSQVNRVNALTDQARTADKVLANVNEMRTLSPQSWGFKGAGSLSAVGSTVLPSWAGGAGAVNTQDLINAAHSNVANVAKSTFGARVTNLDVNLLKDLESSADQPDKVRQKIYNRADRVFSEIKAQDTAEAESILSHKRYKPGGQDTLSVPQKEPPPTTTASATKPTLSEFMVKARAVNPNASEGDLARFWKSKYGG